MRIRLIGEMHTSAIARCEDIRLWRLRFCFFVFLFFVDLFVLLFYITHFLV